MDRQRSLFQELAKELGVVIVLPIYEREGIATYYNTAAVIDADGTYLGKYRKHHIPHVAAGGGAADFGRNIILNLEIWGIPCLIRLLPRLASISAMTGISRRCTDAWLERCGNCV